MKKLLSVLLVLAMIFSTAAFASPVQMGTAATTAELTAASQTALPEAQTAAEEDYGTLIYNITFDGTETVLDGTRRPVSGYGYVNTEVAGFADAKLKSSFTDNEIKDGAAYVGASASYPRIVIYANGSFPEGKYRVSVDFTNNCTDGKRDVTFALDNSWLGGMDAAAGATVTYTNELTFINNELTLLSNKQKVNTTNFGQLDLYTSIGEKGKSSFVYDSIKLYYIPM